MSSVYVNYNELLKQAKVLDKALNGSNGICANTTKIKKALDTFFSAYKVDAHQKTLNEMVEKLRVLSECVDILKKYESIIYCAGTEYGNAVKECKNTASAARKS